MSSNAVELRGFEGALLAWLGSFFRFSDVSLSSLPLTSGRHFFVNFMPEAQAIAQTSAQDDFAYDPTKEPTLAVYTNAGPGIRPSSSRWVKHETSLQFVLRSAGAFEKSKALLEELVQAVLDRAAGKRMGGFVCKAALLSQRPTAFQRQGDDRSFAQATVRFFYIALNL
ncbi:MAG: hypothetical protein ACRD1X_12330 [Vicinamibacteria bacterium]